MLRMVLVNCSRNPIVRIHIAFVFPCAYYFLLNVLKESNIDIQVIAQIYTAREVLDLADH
jgi:predicted histidine transporter YuiF (NhaC family)